MIEIRMPQKGLSEETAILTQWYVKEGDEVKANQYLFSIENGKATYDVETEEAGVVLACFGEENDEIPIETVVCVIGQPGEKYTATFSSEKSSYQNGDESNSKETLSDNKTFKECTVSETIELSTEASHDKLFISPRAKMRAKELGVNVLTVLASGPDGRIVESDILKAKNQMVQLDNTRDSKILGSDGIYVKEKDFAEEDYTIIPHSGIRKAIAKNMMLSLQSMAQLTLTTAYDCTSLIRCKELLNEDIDKFGIDKVTVNDMICFAVAKTLKGFKKLNAHYFENEMHVFNKVNLGIAVSTEKGLLVPVAKNADYLSLFGLIRENRRLIEACRNGQLHSDDMENATFTVTNLGAYGIRAFTPIISPPQVAILGVGAMVKRTEEIRTGIRTYKEMELSLTIDHRGLDGADGANFLKKLVSNLEQFEIVLAL